MDGKRGGASGHNAGYGKIRGGQIAAKLRDRGKRGLTQRGALVEIGLGNVAVVDMQTPGNEAGSGGQEAVEIHHPGGAGGDAGTALAAVHVE